MAADLSLRILQSMNSEVLGQLELSRSIKHPGENGRSRENIIAAFLKRLIPKGFVIDTGFIIDANGGISKQQDLVIYRADYYPVFEIGNIKHFIIESVCAVVENKASISSVEKLEAAMEDIRSVKCLDRTNNGKNYVVNDGKVKGPNINGLEFHHQILGGILTESSLSSELLTKEWLGFCRRESEKHLWPNIYADVRGPILRFASEKDGTTIFTTDASIATMVCLTTPAVGDFSPPLIEFAYELLNFLRITPIIDFQPSSYFGKNIGPTTKTAI